MLNSVFLKSPNRDTMHYIYKMENDQNSNYLWTNNRKPLSEGQFYDDFIKRENAYFNCYFLIFKKGTEAPIGFVYSYGADFIDGFCYTTLYLLDNFRKKGYGAIASAMFIDYLFSRFNYRKIYFDVFGYNNQSLNCLITSGCTQEGCFKQHKYFNNKYHDMLRFALYRDIFYSKNQKIISRTTIHCKPI